MGVVARAHDLLVNTDMGDMKQPEWMVRVKEDYFKAGESMFESRELGELLDEMDAHGRRAGGAHDQHDAPVGAGAVVRRRSAPTGSASASAVTTSCARWRTCAALESFVARPPGRVHGRRPELLGRRHVPAERRGLLPALHEVLRARPAAVHEHRPPRAAHSRARRRTRSTSTASACASPSSGCA